MKKRKVTEQELRDLVETGADLTQLDVSQVTNMSFLFMGKESFNQDISSWDVSNVRDMSRMFQRADTFNQDISTWDVSNVEDMSFMFEGALAFNQDIGKWNISEDTNLSWILYCADAFVQDLSTAGQRQRAAWIAGRLIVDTDLYKYLWSCPLKELPKYMNHRTLAPIVKKRLGK